MSALKPLILIVMPLADQRGGAELALLQLISSDTPYRWHIVFMTDGPMIAQCNAMGVPAIFIDTGRVRQPHKTITAIWKIARLVKKNDAKLILGWMAKAHVYGGMAAWIAGIPAGWFQHGLPTPGSWIDGSANRIPAMGAMACSQFSVDSQLKVTPNLPMRVVYPAADLVRFDPRILPSPGECRTKIGVDGKVIGIFGRLQSWKGMHVLIDAMPKILVSHPDAHLLIVGGAWDQEAEYEQHLKRRVAELNLEQHVLFAGYQKNIPEWMQACDVVIHASDHEPFGMVVVEAMALGKPVVAGANGGPREAITDGVNGILAPFGDSDALAHAVLRYLDDPSFAKRLGDAALQRAQYFSIPRFADGVSRALTDWIESASAKRVPKLVTKYAAE
jgi:glycosyltransferase involved in cell wall biosynthesis